MNFKQLNNIGGWLVFIISMATFTLTVEPTSSFWDCGEFIACAFKLQVPHPAGAPFYLLIGRIFSLFAGSDTTKVALMVNMVSVISSALTITFLFWTISMIARKIIGKNASELSKSDVILIMGAALVGSLAFNFTESFWFSAVEAEVYGMSSFFTAIVVWAAFKWELIEDPADQNKWLIFIAYLVGVSIGVHLLNLVTIPALALIYYFRKSETPNLSGGFIAFIVGMVILGIINSGVITGIPSISFWFDKLFVNSFGLPFGSGMIFFILTMIGLLTYGIYKTHVSGKAIQNTVLISFAFILIGFSSYSIALIRSNFNPPINENDPSDVLNFTSYLKREQYGSRPLLYGPVFSAQLTDIKQGAPIYKEGEKKYEIYDYAPEYEWDSQGKMLLPRVWSHEGGHVALYRSMLNLPEGRAPSFGDNIRFMISHQFNHMFWRYFLWNFWGRASDIQDAGVTNIFESKSSLPPSLASNKARSNFYGLPFLLGILGLIYLYRKNKKDTIVTFLLFFMTGIALVVYLNSPPVEPRERDYIYAGAYYFYAIWIGLAVLAIASGMAKVIKNSLARGYAATGLALIVPVIMGVSNWDGHDRSDRYAQIDFAKNMLDSCAPNAILFTGGDNDTFPLWYLQEVEGYRTDVRVANLSLLGTDWYIEQMKRQTYESEPLPISLKTENLLKGINDQIPFVENPNVADGINIKDFIELVNNNHPSVQRTLSTGRSINILPSSKFYFLQNADEVAMLPFIDSKYKDLVQDVFEWEFGETDIMKNDLVVLDIITQNNWERPIYFGGTLPQSQYLRLREFMQLEGYAYRLMPFKVEGALDGFVNSELLRDNLFNKFKFDGLDNPDIYYETEFYRIPFISGRYAFLRLADEYLREGNDKGVEEALDKILALMPDESIPYDQLVTNFPMFYYEIGKTDKAVKLSDHIVEKADKELEYFIKLYQKSGNLQWGDDNIRESIQLNMRTIQVLQNAAESFDKNTADRYRTIYDKHMNNI